MNRKTLSDFVSERMSITKSDAKAAVEAVFSGLVDGINEGKRVSIMGFGSFYVLDVPERTIKNPKTGEPMKIEARKVLKFKASKMLKDTLNGR